MFPNKKNVEPRYDQITLEEGGTNMLQQVLSPDPNDEGVWVHQNAWFHIGKLDKGTEIKYNVKAKGNGVYAFVLEGSVDISGQALDRRDGYGVWDTDTVNN